METQLVTVPELTFEPSYGSKYGNKKKKNKKEEKIICFLYEREKVHCSRQSQWELTVPGHSVIGVAWFLLFVIFYCNLGPNLTAAKGFSEMDSAA